MKRNARALWSGERCGVRIVFSAGPSKGRRLGDRDASTTGCARKVPAEIGGMARGFFRYPRAVRGPDFNELVADLGDEKSCIARVEPTSPGKSLKINRLELAERVGFELASKDV